MTDIVEVDPHDDAQLRRFWDAEQAAIRADRAHPVIRTYDALAAAVRNPTPYVRRTLLAAVDDGRVVGGVEIAMPQQENTHLGEVEVNVVPEARRQGLGTTLHDAAMALLVADGRTTYTGEAYAPTDGVAGAVAFAQGLGYESVHVEDHLVLPLPVPARRMTDLRAALPVETGYDVVSWGGRCPDEHLTAYCAMLDQMAGDVPTGELDAQPMVFTEERVRLSEQRLSRSYHQLISAVRRRSDGVLGGYSMVFLPHGEPDVIQDDTLVMPGHRGRRLGLLMKVANLDAVARDHPERATVHTWTDPDNTAMRRTNDRVGFTVAERMHQMQRRDGR